VRRAPSFDSADCDGQLAAPTMLVVIGFLDRVLRCYREPG
jgi:hypothetical protein